MSVLAGNTEQRSPLWCHAWATGVALVLGFGAFVLLNNMLAQPWIAAALAVCLTLLVGILLALTLRLRLVRAQSERALAIAGESELNISALVQIQDTRLKQHVVQRFQVLQDQITELRAREELLKVQAYHDGLTGLANRLLLVDRFNVAVERAKRSGKSFALLMIDLNGFKSINDIYGHAAGDVVLITTARRLVGAVRASDTVARFGGDEFVLIIEAIDHPQEIVNIGGKLFDSLADPITLDAGELLKVSASIGLAMYPEDGVTLNDLLHVADQAMYECKSTGMMSLE